MLLRQFTVNNGELEVLEESTSQDGRKLIHKTKFSVDGKEGEFSAVMNSLCGEWELVYGDVYCSSNHEMDIPFTEEDLNAIYKICNRFGIRSVPYKTADDKVLSVTVESIDSIPADSYTNLISIAIRFMKKYDRGVVEIKGRDIYFNGNFFNDSSVYSKVYPPHPNISESYSGECTFYKEPKEGIDPVYIFPDINVIVFGKDARELIIKRIGIDGYKRVKLVDAFKQSYIDAQGSYIPEDIKF